MTPPIDPVLSTTKTTSIGPHDCADAVPASPNRRMAAKTANAVRWNARWQLFNISPPRLTPNPDVSFLFEMTGQSLRAAGGKRNMPTDISQSLPHDSREHLFQCGASLPIRN